MPSKISRTIGGMAAAALLGAAAATLTVQLRPAVGATASVSRVGAPPRPAALLRLPTPPNQHNDCAGGVAPDLDLDVLPDAVVTTNGRESLEYHIEFVSRLKGKLNVTYTVTLADDRGNIISSTQATASGNSAKGAPLLSNTHATPDRLSEGYYRAFISAAATGDDSATATNSYTLYLRLKDGRIQQLDSDSWNKNSQSNLAMPPGSK